MDDMPKAIRRALLMVYEWCKENGYKITILKTDPPRRKKK
jgi:hypothetical protein